MIMVDVRGGGTMGAAIVDEVTAVGIGIVNDDDVYDPMGAIPGEFVKLTTTTTTTMLA
jgi:hypothetical protein